MSADIPFTNHCIHPHWKQQFGEEFGQEFVSIAQDIVNHLEAGTLTYKPSIDLSWCGACECERVTLDNPESFLEAISNILKNDVFTDSYLCVHL